MPSLRSGITSGLGLCICPHRNISQLVRRYYYVYFKPRKTNDGTTCNHGGIGVAIKRHLRNSKAVKALEEKSSKQCDILWLKCDKQHFNLDNGVYMCGTYIPPHNSKYLKDNNIDMFSLIENVVIIFRGWAEHVLFVVISIQGYGVTVIHLLKTTNFMNFLTYRKTMCMTLYHQGDQCTQTLIDTTNLSSICYGLLILGL